MSKEFKKYMSVYMIGWKIFSAISGATMVSFFISMFAGNHVDYFGLLFWIIAFIASLIPWFISLRFFRNLENDIRAYQIEADFRKAIPKFNDNIRLGNQWLFISNRSKLITFSNITRIYPYVKKSDGFVSERGLKYVDTKGHHHKLCKMGPRNDPAQEIIEIISIIQSKNPSVKIGR
ncbi:MAG: hypothetical protein IJB91_01520 [Oscillospiraceae bacterium]|nr:hypothetical protein [Oscillospiraceae bacterium]